MGINWNILCFSKMKSENKMSDEDAEKPILQWKDKKLLAGFILVLLSFILGFYGKGLAGLAIFKLDEPAYLIKGLSLWAFSFALMLLGVFLVGWETVRMIQKMVHNKVKDTVKEGYHYTKDYTKRKYNYTKDYTKRKYKKILKRKKFNAKH